MRFFVLLFLFSVMAFASVRAGRDNFREEIFALQDEIRAKQAEGNTDEVVRLQEEMHAKIDAARNNPIVDLEDERYHPMHDMDFHHDRMHERMHERHLEEMHRHRARRMEERSYSRSSGRRRLEDAPPIDTSGLSDERAIYHMTQIARKCTIITDKFDRFGGAFTSAEVEGFTQRLEEYKVLEKVVAGYLQQTADEFNKARKMKTKEQRLAQIERAKTGKNNRKEDEKAAREAARLKWVALKADVDKLVDAFRAQQQKDEL